MLSAFYFMKKIPKISEILLVFFSLTSLAFEKVPKLHFGYLCLKCCHSPVL